MRPILRKTMAVLLGLMAAVSVNWSLNRPLWRCRHGISGWSTTLGFTAEDRALITMHGWEESLQSPVQPRIVWWDTVAGIIIKQVELEISDRHGVLIVSLGCDGESLLVAENSPGTGGSTSTWKRAVHDLNSGKRTFGPLPDVWSSARCFSSDGRWFCYLPGSNNSIGVRDAKSGQEVLVIPLPDNQDIDTLSFVPNTDRIAVFSVAKDVADDPFAGPMNLEVFEIPSGQSRFRVSMDGRGEFYGWNGDRIRVSTCVKEQSDGGTALARERIQSWRLTDDGLTERRDELWLDPWEEHGGWIYHRFNGDWGVRVASDGAKPGLPGWSNRLQRTLGPKVGYYNFDSNLYLTVFDAATGQIRAEFAEFPGDFQISADGEFIACTTDDGFVEMWDGTPSPRWPWATVAGLAVGGAAWLIAGKLLPRSKPRQVPELAPDSELL
jgi:hypothetical protein